jgi:hypothetical protein
MLFWSRTSLKKGIFGVLSESSNIPKSDPNQPLQYRREMTLSLLSVVFAMLPSAVLDFTALLVEPIYNSWLVSLLQ